MLKYQITVIVCTYNPDGEKLLRTIRSVVFQENVSAQLVIADDGSSGFNFDEIERYLGTIGFKDYVIVKNPLNQGTTLNLASGVMRSAGKYIKNISPGDCLYSSHTLSDLYEFMERKAAKVCFGDAVYYFAEDASNCNLVTVNRNPRNTRVYSEKNYNDRKVKENYLVYNDIILGAVFCSEAAVLKKYLDLIVNKVRYAEDNLFRLMIADGVRFWYFNEYMIWYEYGFGISTSKSKKWQDLIQKDWEATNSVLIEEFGSANKTLSKICRFISIPRSTRVKKAVAATKIYPTFCFVMVLALFFPKKTNKRAINRDFFMRKVIA